MSLPFQPESLTAQQDRYYEAVRETIDLYAHPEYRIGQQRKHVFDSEDGIRLIVSREIHPFGEFIHFSASLDKGSVLHQKALVGFMSVEQACRIMAVRFREISQDYRKAKFLGLSGEKGIPHWTIQLDRGGDTQ